MKVVKITAMWCSACIIMNNVWNKIKNDFDFDIVELDYDLDEEEVEKYDVGKVLPVFIFYDGDKEISRLEKKKKKEDFISKIREVVEK